MSSGMYELKPANLVQGLNVVLPKQNVREFLIANNKITKISEPSEFRKGIVLDIKVTKEGLLLLLSTNEAFESLRKIFKTESIDWYVLKWNFEEWVAILILLFCKFLCIDILKLTFYN